MEKIKVATVIGTRPEIIRLSRVISKLDETVEHVLVHTGQNYDYELNQVFFDDLGLRKPDYFLAAAGETAAETIGLVIQKCDRVLADIKPDALLILGDTNSCLTAIAAKKRKIPIFHMEAGNRCFDQRVPEETNRKLVDHISDVNMPYSSIAREYLLREGIPADRIIKTGSPMKEVLEFYTDRILGSDVLERLELQKNKYLVFSCHREENVDEADNLSRLIELLNYLCERLSQRIIFSTHPRTFQCINSAGTDLNSLIEFHKPFGYFDYIALQKNAYAVFSDSGTITEESSILRFPAFNIRQAHERPEGMEEAAVMLTGFDIRKIEQGLIVLEQQRYSYNLSPVNDYNVDNVSEKVVRIIISYINYINRVVWYDIDNNNFSC